MRRAQNEEEDEDEEDYEGDRVNLLVKYNI